MIESAARQKLRSRLQFAARIALFAAITVVNGYLMMAVPNVELMTATIALSGLFLGPLAGSLTGIVAILVYGGINAWGPTFPPMWIMQMVGMGFAGFLFGKLRLKYSRAKGRERIIISILLGSAVTFLYDLLTNIAFPLATRVEFGEAWMSFIIPGIPFMLLHVGSNILIFALLVPEVFKQFLKRNYFKFDD